MLERLMNSYSIEGLLRTVAIFLGIMLPNLLYFAFPRQEEQTKVSAGKIFDFLENWARILYFIVLFLDAPIHEGRKGSVTLVIALVSIVLYYICWGIYFVHQRETSYMFRSFLGVPVPLAVFPVFFLVMIAIWMECWLLVACGILFGIGHITNTYYKRCNQKC